MQNWSPLSNIGISICSSRPTLLLYLSFKCYLMYFVPLEKIGFYLGKNDGKVIKKHASRFYLVKFLILLKFTLYTQPFSFVNAKANQIQDSNLKHRIVY